MDDASKHYKTGNQFRAQGKTDEAIQAYEKALKENPGFLLAKKSIEFLKKFKEKQHYSFGNLYQSEGNLKEAIEEFKKVIECNPQCWRGYLKLGTLYRETAQLDKAIRVLEKAQPLAPGTAEIHFVLAQTYDLKEEYIKALEAYEAAYKYAPQDKNILKQKKLTEKIADYTERIENRSGNLSLYNETAHLFMEKGMTQKAITLLQRAIKKAPANQEFIYTLGNIYYATNKFKMASRYYKKALSARPVIISSEEIYYNLGLALAAQEKWKEAIKEWEQCIAEAPRSRASLRAKANLELLQRKKYP